MEFKAQILPATVAVDEVSEGVFCVTCADDLGRQYTHEACFSEADRWKAKTLVCRVRDAGKIDLSRWDCYIPYGSEAWIIEGYEVTLMDDEERYHRGFC